MSKIKTSPVKKRTRIRVADKTPSGRHRALNARQSRHPAKTSGSKSRQDQWLEITST